MYQELFAWHVAYGDPEFDNDMEMLAKKTREGWVIINSGAEIETKDDESMGAFWFILGKPSE